MSVAASLTVEPAATMSTVQENWAAPVWGEKMREKTPFPFVIYYILYSVIAIGTVFVTVVVYVLVKLAKPNFSLSINL